MTKEELFKTGTKEEIDKKSKSLWCRIEFAVTCDSSPYIQEGKSVASRVAQYVNDCFEAMDDSMRHWGDHTHMIEPLVVKVYCEDTDEVHEDQCIEIQDELEDCWNSTLEKYDIDKVENETLSR